MDGGHETFNKIMGEKPKRWGNSDDKGTDFNETGCEDVKCIHLDQDRDQLYNFVNTVMKLRVPLKTG
jgi:hypothetical protein